MPDKFSVIPIEQLYFLIVKGYRGRKEIFGIPEKLFFKPSPKDTFRIKRYDRILETPVGIAAGPHSQMAQNIISAWLCGARYIELKTIQTLDDLNVSKPCIDMQDEGYNCEWSQELKINESYEEYLKAWIIIHLLRHKFGWDKNHDSGVIFNMSAGYNMEGILNDNVQWFFSKMKDCSKEKALMVDSLKRFYPDISKIDIPCTISDNITLSTMHGCPPDEIENIGLYLIREKKLHTTVKLNPTLLGPDKLREILHVKLGFNTVVPDLAFEHDLKYHDALKLIISLQTAAKIGHVFFGLKLTNTLESMNIRNVFMPEEKMIYMSGRALHPISISLAKQLQDEFDGELDISFSAGADCFNIRSVLECGLSPVTVCSDILKPGGYGRISQFIEALQGFNPKYNIKETLGRYAEDVIKNPAYHKDPFTSLSIKTPRNLKFFDCINPPCVDTCPTNQDIPDYLRYASQGEFDKAFAVIMKKNPFPNVLGMVCEHLCQSKCTRINYDDPLLIRDIKRFIAENGNLPSLLPAKENGIKVSVIGAGPSGLACAYFLRLAGFTVDVYETRSIPGGMVSEAIPSFRLKAGAIQKDIERICALGVNIHYNCKVDRIAFEKIRENSQYVYIASGAQKFKKPGIEGEDAAGVLDPFEFLSSVKKGMKFNLGKNIIVIGGGNTAMDVARAAYRLAGQSSKVVVVYRRTIREMPAAAEEIKALMSEGIEIIELVAPEKVIIKDGKVVQLVCSRIKPGETDNSGRPKPVKIEGSEFEIPADCIIPSLGQDVVLDFVDAALLRAEPESGETALENVFAGGDVLSGAATVVKAVGDARKVAAQIISKSRIPFGFEPERTGSMLNYSDHIVHKSKRIKGEISKIKGKNFDALNSPLTKEQVIIEASRCLSCDEVCSVCMTVCPNRANVTYFVKPLRIELEKAVREKCELRIEKDGYFEISQEYQVLNIADFCNECGNCTTFCPTNGSPFRDKPKFYLTLKSFRDAENGYTLSRLKNKTVLISKNKGEISTLAYSEGQYYYENIHVQATFEEKNFRLMELEMLSNDVNEVSFREAAEMFVLFGAAQNLFE